jgi:predicted DCC family thiol-disulfide oxidoreductase YuxK
MLLYDGDCGFCTATATWLTGRLRTPVLVRPWQEVSDLGELGLSTEDVATAVYWVDVYGRRYRGHQAIARALRLCRPPLPAAGALLTLPPVSWLARAAYRITAANRHRLPGATAACGRRAPDPDTPPGSGGSLLGLRPGPGGSSTSSPHHRRLGTPTRSTARRASLSRRARRRGTVR